jgi:hypothetical protein
MSAPLEGMCRVDGLSRQFSRFRTAVASGLLLVLFLMVVAAPPADAGITIVNNESLAFGSLVAGSGGTVTIAPSNGARSATGGVTLMNSTYRAARFTVGCTPTPPLFLDCILPLTYSINSVSGITLTSGANSMSVGFSPYSVNSGSSTQGQLLALLGGTDSLKVGGTLTVGNNQASGSYSGSFSVTVTFP